MVSVHPRRLRPRSYAKKYSPDAWILNYSNPAAVVAEATRREFDNDHILNICDMPTAILLSYSKMLGLPSWRDIDPMYFGLNHFGWFTKIYDKQGRDRLPELRQMILEHGMAVSDKHHKDKDWMHTWSIRQDCEGLSRVSAQQLPAVLPVLQRHGR